MSTYTYTGTSGVDDISTYDLNKQNPASKDLKFMA